MPVITPDSFETGRRNGQIAPLYFLFGEEEFLIEEALHALLAVAVDESTKSFNYDQFHGTEIQLRDVVERATAYPMMAERRVVVLRDLDRAIGSRKGDDGSGFLNYIESPLETTTLILTATTDAFLGKGKAKPKSPYDKIIEGSTAVHFRKVYDRELPSWVNRRVGERGKKISPEAVEMFVSYVGASLRTLNNEIEKLFTFVEDRSQISLKDVRGVVGASRTWNVFELQKALGEKKLELAVEIAERMLRAGEPPQLILTMLTRYYTILWRLLEVRTRFKDPKAIAREVGISSFFINEYLSALSRYGLPGIRVAFEALLEADLALKSSRISHSILMQMLLVSIVQGENLMLNLSEPLHHA
ncbi:MAG: DNA polymerase III subunit delta [Candidatus Kapaibacterium sp.]